MEEWLDSIEWNGNWLHRYEDRFFLKRLRCSFHNSAHRQEELLQPHFQTQRPRSNYKWGNLHRRGQYLACACSKTCRGTVPKLAHDLQFKPKEPNLSPKNQLPDKLASSWGVDCYRGQQWACWEPKAHQFQKEYITWPPPSQAENDPWKSDPVFSKAHDKLPLIRASDPSRVEQKGRYIRSELWELQLSLESKLVCIFNTRYKRQQQ